ncbi:hypothetical protein PAP_06640 [Palaeococcus pacificus DY20341]|uniref:Uncharacterized protein n=1 Tax=Palaeococcus pacificus DY20341 TaxID=1343739 RepID=A0A075LYS6_9EURY|nr:hypothetical protein PAP_06640 [Palaeococcus pacificus DY20341]
MGVESERKTTIWVSVELKEELRKIAVFRVVMF